MFAGRGSIRKFSFVELASDCLLLFRMDILIMLMLIIMSMVMAEEVFAWPEFFVARIGFTEFEHFGPAGEDFLDERRPHLIGLSAGLQVFVAVKKTTPIDPGLFTAAEVRQRRAAPDHQIRVLTGLERADLMIDTELFGRVERDELERL